MKFWAKNARRDSLRGARTGLSILPAVFIALVVIAALLLSTLLGVSEGKAFSQETTLRTESNAVLIPALVKDPQGRIVYGLQGKDFMVEDDGVKRNSMDAAVVLGLSSESALRILIASKATVSRGIDTRHSAMIARTMRSAERLSSMSPKVYICAE